MAARLLHENDRLPNGYRRYRTAKILQLFFIDEAARRDAKTNTAQTHFLHLPDKVRMAYEGTRYG